MIKYFYHKLMLSIGYKYQNDIYQKEMILYLTCIVVSLLLINIGYNETT